MENIVVPVDKSDPSFVLQTDFILGGNGRAKINTFLDYIEVIIIGFNLRSNTPQVFTLPRFALIYYLTPLNNRFPVL